MNKTLLIPILILSFLRIQLQAQTATLTLSNLNINGSTVTFDLNIAASNGDIFLGNSDFVLSFNQTAFSNPVFSVNGPGDFPTESGSTSDAAITQDSYFFNSAASIISGNLVINLSGPNPGNTAAFERRVAKFPDARTHILASFQITGYTGGDFNFNWVSGSTLLSTITLPSFTEIPVTLNTTTALPVELNLFDAAVQRSNIVSLVWQTASEKDNEGFLVQHSQDGLNWKELTFVKGQGTTTDVQNYQYLHRNAATGNNYYRLKQIDFDNNFEYSDIEVVEIKDAVRAVKIYPNPITDTVHIELDNTNIGGDIKIYNLQGNLVYEQAIDTQAFTQILHLGHLPSGVYQISIPGTSGFETQQLILQHP